MKKRNACLRKKNVEMTRRNQIIKMPMSRISLGSGAMVIDAWEVYQNGRPFCVFVLPHRQLEAIQFVRVLTEQDPDGNQRSLNVKHVENFTKSIKAAEATRMQSIVGVFSNGVMIGLPPSYNDKKPFNLVKVIFPKSSGEFLQIADGQHSLTAVEEAGEKISDQWCWSISAALHNDPLSQKSLFSDINGTAKRHDPAIVWREWHDAGRLSPSEMNAGDIIKDLNKDENSVLHKRIYMSNGQRPGQNGGLVKINYVGMELSKIFSIPQINDMTYEEIYALVKEYFNAWARTKPKIWADNKCYFLGGPIGIRALSRLIEPFFIRSLELRGELTLGSIASTVQWAGSNLHDLVFVRSARGMRLTVSVQNICDIILEKIGASKRRNISVVTQQKKVESDDIKTLLKKAKTGHVTILSSGSESDQ